MGRRPVLPRLLVLAAAGLTAWRSGAGLLSFVSSGEEDKRAHLDGDANLVLSGPEVRPRLRRAALRRGGLGLEAEGPRLRASYAAALDEDTALRLALDDEQAWQAALEGRGQKLLVRGQGLGLENLAWEASKVSDVDGVGTVGMEFDSDEQYKLSVTRDDLAELGGVRVGARAVSSNEGLAGRLSARRALPGGAEVSYSVENSAGKYDVRDARHRAALRAPLAGGELALAGEGDAGAQAFEGRYRRAVAGGDANLLVSHRGGAPGYNVSYARPFGGEALDGHAELGLDDAAAFGRLAASRGFGPLSAAYEADAQVLLSEGYNKTFSHALTVSHKHGHVKFAQRQGEPPVVNAHVDFGA